MLWIVKYKSTSINKQLRIGHFWSASSVHSELLACSHVTRRNQNDRRFTVTAVTIKIFVRKKKKWKEKWKYLGNQKKTKKIPT